MDMALINESGELLKKLREEMTEHYKEFFLPTAKDEPSRDLQEFDKYICRVLKVTNHLVKSDPDYAPLLTALREIDVKLGTRDAHENTVLAFAERYCVVGLGKKVSQKFVDSLLTSGGMRYRSRFVIPWYKAPVFLAYDILVKEIREYSEMVHARYELEMDINEEKAQRRPDAYGEKDVLEQQIAGAKARLAAAQHWQASRVESIRKLTDFIQNAAKQKDTLELFKSAKQFALEEKRELELTAIEHENEKQLAVEAERELTRQICANIARLEQEVEGLVQQILELQATCTLRRKEVEKKAGECNEVARRVEALEAKVAAKQAQIDENQKECERVKQETDRLNLNIQGMAAAEARVRMRIQMEIAAVEEQIEEFDAVQKREEQTLEGLRRRKKELEVAVLPDLEYEIEKGAEELEFQRTFAWKQKALVEMGTLGVISTGLREVVGEKMDQESLAQMAKRLREWT
jgi:DNA repair exonuclease SbcCD ATPase subunit